MKTKVFIAIPTTGTVVDGQSFVLRRIEERYKDHVEFVYPTNCTRRIFHDFARNELAREFLESDADILWFLDSDVTPPDHIMDLVAIHKDKWKVAGAPYPVVMAPALGLTPQIVMTVYEDHEDGLKARPNVPQEGTDFVGGLATGCLFIKREVLEQVEKPYFEFKYDPNSRCIIEGEDLGFGFKLKKLGIRVFTDFGMVCKHQKTVCLLDLNNYAMEFANRAVIAYDATVKEQVKEAMAAAFERGVQAAVNQMKKPSSTIWTP